MLTDPPLIQVTPDAVAKIRAIALEEGRAPRLRIAIEGGGCSGFRYRFDFEETVDEDDHLIPLGALDVVVDPVSAMYLRGATLSHEESLLGSQLTLRNPNATHTCGCGSSFSTEAA